MSLSSSIQLTLAGGGNSHRLPPPSFSVSFLLTSLSFPFPQGLAMIGKHSIPEL